MIGSNEQLAMELVGGPRDGMRCILDHLVENYYCCAQTPAGNNTFTVRRHHYRLRNVVGDVAYYQHCGQAQ